jgi:nucleotide-binding universal stress UspA family protein
MTLKRILVAVHSPTGPDAAFERGLALAKSAGAELYLLHAVPLNQRYSFRAGDRLERMADLRKRAEDAGVRVHTAEQHGDAAETIRLHANAREVDLIVIGSGALGGWANARSTVAHAVVRRTSVPTLVVPSDGAADVTPFRNVLAAVDLRPDSQDVVRGALEMTAPQAGQLTVMHAVKGLEAADAVQNPARWKVPEFRAHVLDDTRRTLEGLVSDVSAPVKARVHVSGGSPAREVLAHAADVDADLIVVGRGRGFKLLGSTALRVLRNNDRALLVIPSAARRPAQVEGTRAA